MKLPVLKIFGGFGEVVSLLIRHIPIIIFVKLYTNFTEIMLDVVKNSVNYQAQFNDLDLNGHYDAHILLAAF